MKNIILHKINGDIYSYRPYGICQDTSEIQNKTVQIVSPDNSDTNHEFSLVPGATILVTFTDVNNTSNTTLNVNNTGAKPIFIGNTELGLNQTWVTNGTIEFRYDGEHWIILNGPIKGAGYFTEADKQEFISELTPTIENMINQAIGEIENGTY
jgi:hypothetical protein